MFMAYVGTPGSGKTYDAVRKIIDNLKIKRVVYTNIDGLCEEKARKHIQVQANLQDSELTELLHHLDNKQIYEFWDHAPQGALVVVDECHLLFSNRDWNTEKNRNFVEWGSTHRHKGYDVLLITQDLEKIDKHARSLVEWTFFYKKIGYFGSLVKNKYLRHSYDSDSHSGKPISSDRCEYEKKIFDCYNSYDNSKIKEVGIQKNINILNTPVVWAIPVVFCLMIYFVFKSDIMSGSLFGAKTAIVEKKINNNKTDIMPKPINDFELSKKKISFTTRYALNTITRIVNNVKSTKILYHGFFVYAADFPYPFLEDNGDFYTVLTSTQSADVFPPPPVSNDKTVPSKRIERTGLAVGSDEPPSNEI